MAAPRLSLGQLSLFLPSNHLIMQWQATLPRTVIKNENNSFIQKHPLPLPVQGMTTSKLYHKISEKGKKCQNMSKKEFLRQPLLHLAMAVVRFIKNVIFLKGENSTENGIIQNKFFLLGTLFEIGIKSFFLCTIPIRPYPRPARLPGRGSYRQMLRASIDV